MEKLGLSCGESQFFLLKSQLICFLGSTQEHQYAVSPLRQGGGALGVHTACNGLRIIATDLANHRNVHAFAEGLGQLGQPRGVAYDGNAASRFEGKEDVLVFQQNAGGGKEIFGGGVRGLRRPLRGFCHGVGKIKHVVYGSVQHFVADGTAVCQRLVQILYGNDLFLDGL